MKAEGLGFRQIDSIYLLVGALRPCSDASCHVFQPKDFSALLVVSTPLPNPVFHSQRKRALSAPPIVT